MTSQIIITVPSDHSEDQACVIPEDVTIRINGCRNCLIAALTTSLFEPGPLKELVDEAFRKAALLGIIDVP